MKHRINLLLLVLLFVTLGANSRASAEPQALKWNGDFRFRNETIDTGIPETSIRQRIRARLGLEAQLSDTVKTGIQLSTGSLSNALTNTTTIGDGFLRKAVGINLAYLDWNFGNLTMTLGKMNNHYLGPANTELVWDNDLRPEGSNFNYRLGLENFTLDLNGGLFWVQEDLSEDNLLYALRVVGTFSEAYDLGLAYYSYTNLGNLSILDITAAIWLINKKLGIIADYVMNIDADSDNTGYLFGLAYKQIITKGDLGARVNYRRLGANAVNTAFTDSDFAGGGTDVKGIELGAGYGLTDFAQINGTFFMNSDGVDAPTDYYRGQMDLLLNF